MKIFRVHLTDDSGMSLCYEYYSNRKDAEESLKKNNQIENITAITNDSIEVREVVIGKYEILKLLNDWASHADNG